MTRKGQTAESFPVLDDAALVLDRDDQLHETVQVPEWGVAVNVVSLSGVERDALEQSMLVESRDAKGNVTREVSVNNLRAKMVAASVRKPDGAPVFTPGQAVALGMKNAAALDRIFRVAQRLSGMTDDDVNELAQGLEQGPSDDSGSA